MSLVDKWLVPAIARTGTLLAVVCIAGGAGCSGSSGSTARLSGEVTLDGHPLPSSAMASVIFRPAAGSNGRPTTAEVADSRYDCPTVPLGATQAQVVISIPTSKTYRSDRTGKDVPVIEDVQLDPNQAQGIPIEVTSDATVDFEMRRAKK